ncbi:hypothetical protein E8E13_010450 [Curvularia kusanoi]|uniref:Cytochrome b561 domain-containing protein n=1 Tax=Curvularia kusanoi TaxID=90978 RepID=A0A9P4TKB0_CURKU|nr:hypothetical protein E8E13_010450 [Curvularia kusanoi]
MRSNRKTTFFSGLLALVSQASAQVASVCPSTNVCFKLNIPESTASSGTGDIFFQISAPTTYSWVALGQGRAMSGSNMFVVYTSAGGNNVTLSPRSASGYNMPTLNSNTQVELLEGSGVSNGIMTANVKCSNCNSWSGGTADFTASSGNWVYAYLSGSALNTNDQSASIRQHNQHDSFSWQYTNAKGGSSVNPFVNAAPAASGTGSSNTGSGGSAVTSCIPRGAAQATGGSISGTATAASPTQTSGGDDNDSDDDSRTRGERPTASPTAWPTGRGGDDHGGHGPPAKRQNLPYCDEVGDGNGGFTSIGSGGGGFTSERRTMLIAHGVLASLAFVILFPAGAIAIRLASFPGVVWLHAAFQVFAYLVYIAAFGLGVYIASEMEMLDHHHPIIGIVVLILVFLQPFLGFLHHMLFKKYQSRTLWSYAHIWVGRIAVTLGIINGGLGLQWADSMNMSSRGGIIAYAVIAVFVWLAWVAASIIGERRRSRKLAEAPPKYEGQHGSRNQGTNSDGASSSDDIQLVQARMHGHYAPKNQ